MPLGKFTEVILPVQDLDTAITQYEALGFRVVAQDNWGCARMQRADLRIGLTSGAPSARPYLSFEVGDIATAVERLRQAGMVSQGEVVTNAAGDRGIHLLDASGNDFFIFQNRRPLELENE